MRKIMLLTFALAILALTACQKMDGYGQLSFSLQEGEVSDIAVRGRVSDYAALPPEENFTLSIKSGSSIVWTGPLSTYKQTARFKAGSYTAEANYGAAEEEGYEKPYFFGAVAFSIVGGQTTAVTMPVSLGNAIVKIVTTASFDNYYVTRSFKITTGAGNVFDNVSRPVFIDAYKFSLTGSLTTQGGIVKTISEKSWNVEAATCYTIKFDVTNTGITTISISFDDTVQEVSFVEELNN